MYMCIHTHTPLYVHVFSLAIKYHTQRVNLTPVSCSPTRQRCRI